jgi:hypothetical protein
LNETKLLNLNNIEVEDVFVCDLLLLLAFVLFAASDRGELRLSLLFTAEVK